MAIFKPFQSIRPSQDKAKEIAALPYDVYSRKEAKEFVKDKPLSFLNIDRPETSFEDTQDMYALEVYQFAHHRLWEMVEAGDFIQDEKPCYYLYRLTFKGRSQYGFVGLASAEDYENNIVKKHEKTREDKEQDRIRHIQACKAQTGPIFLAFEDRQALILLQEEVSKQNPIYDFVSEDGVGHTVWIIEDIDQIKGIEHHFSDINYLYIADGHHRAASAVKSAKVIDHPEAHLFLSIAFPKNQLEIMDYNRLLHIEHLENKEGILEEVLSRVTVLEQGERPFSLDKKGEVNLYYKEKWYKVELPKVDTSSVVDNLDVSILQNQILEPIFGIEDPRTNEHIEFIGGIRGNEELKTRADQIGGMAFGMYPTSMEELFEVANQDLLMPPKSTWFEPKLRSGLFIHGLK